MNTSNPISLEARVKAAGTAVDKFLATWIGAGYIDSLGQQVLDDIVIAITTVPSLSVEALQQRADAIVTPILGAIPNPVMRELAQAIIPALINKWIASGDALLLAKAEASSQNLTLAAGYA